MFYILKDKKVLIVEYKTWAEWIESNHIVRKVKQTQFDCGIVSTVFLGLDHNFSGIGLPILFESRVFGGVNDGDMMRYCTWDEAENGHDLMFKENLKANLQLN